MSTNPGPEYIILQSQTVYEGVCLKDIRIPIPTYSKDFIEGMNLRSYLMEKREKEKIPKDVKSYQNISK